MKPRLKKEAIEDVQKICNEMVKALEIIDDRLIALGFSIHPSFNLVSSEAHLTYDAQDMDEFNSKLHEARQITKLDLESYWVPWAGAVCVKFKGKDKTFVRFLINGDHDEIINKVSSGKCKVVETKQLGVECQLV